MSESRFTKNPFFVLEVEPQADAATIERAAQRWLSLLAVGASAHEVTSYQTPLGPVSRTPEAVREALAELRDPDRRLEAELWATVSNARPNPPPTSAKTHRVPACGPALNVWYTAHRRRGDE